MTRMLAAVIAEAIAIALLGVLVLGLLRSHALILKALHELGAGLELEKEATGAPADRPGPVPVELERGVVPATRTASAHAADIVGVTLDGQQRTLTATATGSRTLLAFLTTGCSVCHTFWEEFAHGVEVPGNGRLAVIAKGPQDESASSLRRLAGAELEVIQSSAAWTDYDIPGSPYFVYVEGGVVTGEGSSTSWPQVRDLMSQAVSDANQARTEAGRTGPGGLPVGTRVTDIVDRGERDQLGRIDSELLGSGIHPGHPSLYQSPDPEPHEHP